MATVGDFKDALKKVLTQNGGLDRIDAHTKAEVFSALDKTAPLGANISCDAREEESYLVNELILEYLMFNDLKFTESVFRSEVNHKHDPMTRRLLCQTLNVKPTVSAKVISNTGDCRDLAVAVEKPVPLLYYFVKHFKDARND